jgi:hypothetical protein
MAKIEGLRDALASDDPATVKRAVEGYPACGELPPVALAQGQPSPRDKGCLSDVANALGSKKGFVPLPPDHAAEATVALVLTRDGRGDWIAHADIWLGTLKAGKGPGADALRLAVARRMADVAPMVGRKIDSEADALATLKAIATAIPGACPTYWMLGSGVDPKTISAELSSEHSACVHKDLSRREGVGAGYGEGTFRALEGALAVWREEERALRRGATLATPTVKAALDKKLPVIEDATKKNETKKLEGTTSQRTIELMGDVHADAGIKLWRDAGADGGDEAGAPKPPPLKRPLP